MGHTYPENGTSSPNEQRKEKTGLDLTMPEDNGIRRSAVPGEGLRTVFLSCDTPVCGFVFCGYFVIPCGVC